MHVVQYDAGDTETHVEERVEGQKELCQDTPRAQGKLQLTTETRILILCFRASQYKVK